MLGGADGRDLDSSLGENRLCQGIGDVDEELVHHVVPNLLTFDLVEFEGESIGDVMLFPIRHAVPELGRLAEMVREAFTAGADLRTVDLFGVADEGVDRPWRMHRAAAT
jgi:hypothetical protein